MRERTFVLITKNNTMRGLCKRTKCNTTSVRNKIIIITIRTLGAKPQHEDLLFALAEEVEHP